MPDSQSSEPGFESPLLPFRRLGIFCSLHCGPSWLSCINEYLAIDSGGHVSDVIVARNCGVTRMLPGEAELVSKWTGLPGRAKSVKSNGLDTALYKNYLFYISINTSNLVPSPSLAPQPNGCQRPLRRSRVKPSGVHNHMLGDIGDSFEATHPDWHQCAAGRNHTY